MCYLGTSWTPDLTSSLTADLTTPDHQNRATRSTSLTRVPGELAINSETLGSWVQKNRQANPEPVPDMSPADHGRLAELEEQNPRLKTENEFLKYPRLGAGLSEKSALIEAEKANFPIEWMCSSACRARRSTPGGSAPAS